MTFRMTINNLLNDIGKEIHPNENIVYDLNVSFGELIDPNSEVINIKIDGDVVDVDNLSTLQRVRTRWLLFAAFHEYSIAPLAFIDLDLMDDKTVTLINPIVQRMSNRIQVFIDSSSPHYSHLAKIHYGVVVNVSYSNQILSNKFCIP